MRIQAAAGSYDLKSLWSEAMADPQTVEEIRRILLLNVGIRENRASAANVK